MRALYFLDDRQIVCDEITSIYSEYSYDIYSECADQYFTINKPCLVMKTADDHDIVIFIPFDEAESFVRKAFQTGYVEFGQEYMDKTFYAPDDDDLEEIKALEKNDL